MKIKESTFEHLKKQVSDLTLENDLLKTENERLKQQLNFSIDEEYKTYIENSMAYLDEQMQQINKLREAYEALYTKKKKYISKEKKVFDKAVHREIKDIQKSLK